jgi:2-polyprenyl-3-methyl-5-hydroxy-6-metoxy-1,4-benzoquinol methylase
MSGLTKTERQIAVNIRAHDKVAKRYEFAHGEIYNPIEQARLRDSLEAAIACIRTDSAVKRVLDFGCGVGNLTNHISDLGCDVLASDVSSACLRLVASRDCRTKIDTFLLNGVDLAGIADNSVDMVATYSVLHHIPDYLGILPEFLRVVKPGGVVFIDHELTEEYWFPTLDRVRFLEEITPPARREWKKYFKFSNYINWFMCKFLDPRYRPEGDIHVFVDDHIEWNLISSVLRDHGAEILKEEKYLLYRRGYELEIYKRHAGKTSDMQALTARKIYECNAK